MWFMVKVFPFTSYAESRKTSYILYKLCFDIYSAKSAVLNIYSNIDWWWRHLFIDKFFFTRKCNNTNQYGSNMAINHAIDCHTNDSIPFILPSFNYFIVKRAYLSWFILSMWTQDIVIWIGKTAMILKFLNYSKCVQKFSHNLNMSGLNGYSCYSIYLLSGFVSIFQILEFSLIVQISVGMLIEH